MSQTTTRQLAEKIAQMIDAETQSTDLSSLASSIDKINDRLDRLELASGIPHSALRSIQQSIHPSQDRFEVIEAVADEVLAQYKNEKACKFEPNGKPCDHCAMCSSRGF
ncbi:MAG: hypothetical protein M3Q26_01770 [Acidobacteriota bacterium]|nr:hypothetical protein [Acidobacteriota bacterium]